MCTEDLQDSLNKYFGSYINMYNVLICDDEKDIVNALKIYLSSPDLNFFEAENGVEALEI